MHAILHDTLKDVYITVFGMCSGLYDLFNFGE